MVRGIERTKGAPHVLIGNLYMGIPATATNSQDGLANPQQIRYSLRNNVIQNETFPRKTSLCAQIKSLWVVTMTFCTSREEDKDTLLNMIDPDSGGSAGPINVSTPLLGIRSFWIESVNCTQPDGMDPMFFQWDMTFVQNVR